MLALIGCSATSLRLRLDDSTVTLPASRGSRRPESPKDSVRDLRASRLRQSATSELDTARRFYTHILAVAASAVRSSRTGPPGGDMTT